MRKLNASLICFLCGIVLFFLGCVKKTELNIGDSGLNTEALSTTQSGISSDFLTRSNGKWDLKWKQEIRYSGNDMYDTAITIIPYTYPAIGTFHVNCQGNIYDTNILVYNTYEYEKVTFFNNSGLNYSFLTKQQQPVTYNLNCSLNPQVYTLNSPVSSGGSWSFSSQEMKLSWNFIEFYIDNIYPVTRHIKGDLQVINEDSFYLEGIDSSFHESPTTAINPPFRFKYLVVRSN